LQGNTSFSGSDVMNQATSMKPSDLKRVVERLRTLGFEVTIRPGPVDRASRPMSVGLTVKMRDLSIAEREAFVAFLTQKAK
jgi:hypothetical protein